MIFEEEVEDFIKLAAENNLRIIMVGGGAVNFHGYRRHSADVDFWIDLQEANLINLTKVLRQMGYEFGGLPKEVREGAQNISLKISPTQEVELITSFNPGMGFEEAWKKSAQTHLSGKPGHAYRVLHWDGLIESKLRSGRPKDLLDIQELQRIKDSNN